MELNGFEIDVYNQYGIQEGAKTSTCPVCSENRSTKNQKQKCAKVFWDTGLIQCSHEGCRTQLHTYKKKEVVKVWKKPIYKEQKQPYSQKLIDYIVNTRKLDESVLGMLKIREVVEWMPQTEKKENCIAWDYFLDNELVNTKFRDGDKNFKLVSGAEKIFYNLDAIRTSKICVIVEGEFDVMAYYSANVFEVISVPNGFNAKGTITLDYLDEYLPYFDNKDVIYIAVDNDDAGIKGRDEFIRRLGPEKIKKVDFKDCKDANAYLKKYGKIELKETLENAKEIPVSGVFRLMDRGNEMLSSFRNGKVRGTTTHIKDIDKHWTWKDGEVTVWTGYQNEGKTKNLHSLSLLKALHEGWKFGVFSPENFPLDDYYDDIIEELIGKSSDKHFSNVMSEREYKYGMQFVDNHFFAVYPDENFQLDLIFKKAKYLIRKHGIKAFIIDPYNTVEHMLRPGEREDLYISRFMAQLKRFGLENGISIHLVAHQITPQIDKETLQYKKPDLNRIKGGSTFADKADNVNFVQRPYRALDKSDTRVMWGSQKIKKQRLVGIPGEVVDINFLFHKQRYLYPIAGDPLVFFDKKRNKELHIENEGKQVKAFSSDHKIDNDYDFTDQIEIKDSDVPF